MVVHEKKGRLYVSINDFIKLFHYPRVAVFQAKKAGLLDDALLPVEGKKAQLVDLAHAVRLIEASGGDYTKQKTRKTTHEADLLEMKAQVQRGELISAKTVIDAVVGIMRITRTRLEILPDRLDAELAQKSQQEVNQALTAEVEKTIEQMKIGFEAKFKNKL